MNATRLLVLGAIRIMAPVHGYDVRRELTSWRLEEIANIKPGSIYSAIRTLLKDGCIAVHAHESGDNRPDRTSYTITGEGEKEFQLLMREAWWTVRSPTESLIPALSLMPFMPREELIRALQARIVRTDSEIESCTFFRRTIKDGATGADGQVPEHVREIMDFRVAHLRAELDWTRKLQERLKAGAYRFVSDKDFQLPHRQEE